MPINFLKPKLFGQTHVKFEKLSKKSELSSRSTDEQSEQLTLLGQKHGNYKELPKNSKSSSCSDERSDQVVMQKESYLSFAQFVEQYEQNQKGYRLPKDDIKKIIKSKDIEGNFTDDLVNTMGYHLELLIENDSPYKEQYNAVVKLIEPFSEYVSHQHNSYNVDSFHDYARFVYQQLSSQQKILVPVFSKSHAMLMLFEKENPDEENLFKQTYTVYLFNTGSGLENHFNTNKSYFHQKIPSSKLKYNTCFTARNIDATQLTEKDIQDLLECNRHEDINFIYQGITGRGFVDLKTTDHLKAQQKGSSCTYQCLNAFLRHQLTDAAYTHFQATFATKLAKYNSSNRDLSQKQIAQLAAHAQKRQIKANLSLQKENFLKNLDPSCYLREGFCPNEEFVKDIYDIARYLFHPQNHDKYAFYHQQDTSRIYRVKKEPGSNAIVYQELLFSTKDNISSIDYVDSLKTLGNPFLGDVLSVAKI